jgi:hypothetical protein
MSYTSSFHDLIGYNPGSDLSSGCYVLMAASNQEYVEMDLAYMPLEPMAHVLAYFTARIRWHVAVMFSKDCPPPVVNDKAATVTAPAASGQGVGALNVSSVSRTATQLPQQQLALSTRTVTAFPPVDGMGSFAFRETQQTSVLCLLVAVPLPVPAVGSGVSLSAPCFPLCGPATLQRRSNLDLNGRLVKKGALVSWHGYRFTVSKVRMGTVYPRQYGLPHSLLGLRFLDCESVQVVQ